MRGAVLLLALCLVAAGCAGPRSTPATSSGPADTSASTSAAAETASPTPSLSGTSTGRSPDTAFPPEVAGLPVITVARAAALLASGDLEGRAVAVAGYYNQVAMPCPYPGRYIGPLVSWCGFAAFTDTAAGAQLCQPLGSNGTSCSRPSGTHLSPFMVSETGGSIPPSGSFDPIAVVLVGHAGDARQWQCTVETQAECADAFVVDRVAWAAGRDVPLAAPRTGDQTSGAAITPAMTLAQAAAAAGVGNELLTGAAFRAGDIATVDPRWNLAGDTVVWLLRSLARAPGSGAGEAPPETVWLVDDATGRVIDSLPLLPDAGYRPARLWQMATVHGVDCCAGSVFAYDRVESGDGTVVREGMVSRGSSGSQDATTFGSGYESLGPLVLPAGDYTVSAWLASYDRGTAGAPRDACSTRVSLGPLGDVALNADFPAGHPCTFKPAPLPTSGP